MSRLLHGTESRLIRNDGMSATYAGQMVRDWDIGSVPNGGYSLGTVIFCAQQYLQNVLGSTHTSVFHAGSSYYAAVSSLIGWEVEIRVAKKGRSFTNIDAELKQKSRKSDDLITCLRVQLLFADYAAVHQADETTKGFNLSVDSPLRPRLPLHLDSTDQTSAQQWFLTSEWPKTLFDKDFHEEERKKGFLSSGSYMYMPEEHIDAQDIPRYNHTMIAMYCDMAGSPFDLLPPAVFKDDKKKRFWYPTMFLSIELQRALPTDFPLQRIAAIAKTNEVRAGQWGYDVEIWSHPLDAGRLHLPKGVDSVRIALARQVALTLPLSLNQSFAKGRIGQGEPSAKL